MIYLNNAATTFPKPEGTLKALQDYLGTTPLKCLRTGYVTEEDDTVSACRKKLAELFNAPNEKTIAFTSGATESLNLAINGLDLKRKHVITTQIEHNAVLRPLQVLVDKGDIELTVVRCDESGIVNAIDIADAIKENTRAIVLNHSSNVTGEVIDLDAVRAVIRDRDILLIVDAAQSAGCIPIDVEEAQIDVLCFTGHKSLYGIPGLGGIYIKEGLDIKPLMVGGSGSKSELAHQPEERPLYYEAGTPNIPGIVALSAGIDFINEKGMETIEQKKRELFTLLSDGLKDIKGVRVYGRDVTRDRVPIICFNIEGLEADKTAEILESSFEIITRSGLHCAPLIHKAIGTFPAGSVRVSPSFFTTLDEIDKFLYAVKHIVEAKDEFESAS